MERDPLKYLIGLACTAFLLLTLTVVGYYQYGYCEATEWQVHQSVFTGKLTVIDQSGPYWRAFGKVWECPYVMELEFNESNGQAMKTTFNDVGFAYLGCYARVETPTTEVERLRLHRDSRGNSRLVENSVGKHMAQCVSVTGPVMSSSEHQASRKAEFNSLVQEQLSRGLFKTESTTVELDDVAEVEQGADGKVIPKKAKVNATLIVRGKDGHYEVSEPSPLLYYGLNVKQFSVTEPKYDPRTEELFAKKKESFLRAEQSKADRQSEIAERLKVEEQGRRQVAEVEARENQKKREATIQAEQRAEVAVIVKKEAVTKASQAAEVAEQTRLEALKLKDIAKIAAETAELNKQKVISEAQARKESIALGGGISEKDRVLAEIESKTRIGVAEAMSKRLVPKITINGQGVSGNDPTDLTTQLMNLRLLETSELLKDK